MTVYGEDTITDRLVRELARADAELVQAQERLNAETADHERLTQRREQICAAMKCLGWDGDAKSLLGQDGD